MLQTKISDTDLRFQDQMDEIMDNMDFSKIAKIMDVLDWKWADLGCVPEEHEIRTYARSVMRKCLNSENNYCEVGGFVARIEDRILTLSFVVENWSAE